jgi:hypothetical protein
MTRTILALGLALGLTAPAAAQHESSGAAPLGPCVAVSPPVVAVPDGVDPAEFSTTLQQGLVEALAAEGLAAHALEAGASPAEAACATVASQLTIKRRGRPSWMRRVLTDTAIAAVWQAPARGIGGVVATAAAGSGLQALSSASAVAKAHDEVTFTYGATVAGRPAVRETTGRAKVETDADDVFTPLVAGAAKAIAASLRKSAGSRR